MHGRSYTTIKLRIPKCRDGARRVFTDRADIACTKRKAGVDLKHSCVVCWGQKKRRDFAEPDRPLHRGLGGKGR